ncbi:MAG: Smr/MutS family protein [Deltaproteobacteria bacterium]|nr:Smr/MutS family protein [Deltaproteobacteria bacterium]
MDEVECHNCGVPGMIGKNCFKCGAKLQRRFSQPLLVIDVAHSGEDREDAARKVARGIEAALNGSHRGLKVIHGRGEKTGRPGVIKNHVVGLLRREAKRLEARVAADRNNPGAHILYFE